MVITREATVADEQVNEEILESAETAAQASEDVVGDEVVPTELVSQIEALTAALASAKEQALRAQAEEQNARRRAQQDVEKAHKFGLEKFVGDLLPVADNLDRALAAIDTDDAAFKSVAEGLELTRKAFSDILAKHQVIEVNPAGEPFDPQLHQAMTMVESPNVEPNSVIDVFQKGYTLHGRLVRPAMVVVAK
jgi:molecular chaperone GrpE|tara:strand:- start:21 stop:599 length:579 start_codon:yes stop_codon:yes gene_type:complete